MTDAEYEQATEDARAAKREWRRASSDLIAAALAFDPNTQDAGGRLDDARHRYRLVAVECRRLNGIEAAERIRRRDAA